MANGSEFGARHGTRRPLFGVVCCSSSQALLWWDGSWRGIPSFSNGETVARSISACGRYKFQRNRTVPLGVSSPARRVPSPLNYTTYSISGFSMAEAHSSHFPQFLCRYKLTPTRPVSIPQHQFLVLVLVLVFLLPLLRRSSALHSSINYLVASQPASQPTTGIEKLIPSLLTAPALWIPGHPLWAMMFDSETPYHAALGSDRHP
ncbi:hypothetical protein S7711_11059 [Stachybotrys chartarum IBT 7711]|uniref:Uncharacterized protein n=1 Tax=Stachybotrys chartarum (strain CBS 109288 / IBT 7711) TaxID=1280523 RepID=A0A084AKY8_STACB|nr:hypothetical protein S7711_11059 [Stachybotrys chartarum IBT 7711]